MKYGVKTSTRIQKVSEGNRNRRDAVNGDETLHGNGCAIPLHQELMPKSSRKRKRLDPETAQIAIIGSGLAGLSAAVSLEQQGFRNIRIYERDASWNARKEGYGLTLQYSSTALRKLGILDDISEADCPSRSHYLFHSDGTIHGYFGNDFSPERGWGQRGNLRGTRENSILFV